MLPNERFALECRAYYDEIGLVVDERNGEFAHSPLTRKECETGYYLLHGHHQHQGLLQSADLGKCCFFPYDALTWLKECGYWPENYFELWDIYEKYSSDHGRKNAEKQHKTKDKNGKSLQGVENAKRLHKVKDENGKSLNCVKGGKKVHEVKHENGKSLQGIELAKRLHNEKNENGKSSNAVKAAKKLHKEKDENGKSLQGIENAKRLHKVKDENGKSLNCVKGAKKTAAQVWESTVDGFRSTPGAVANHNKAKGWDPNARVRVREEKENKL